MKLSFLQLASYLDVYGLKADALVLEDGNVVFDVRGQLFAEDASRLFERFRSSAPQPAWAKPKKAADQESEFEVGVSFGMNRPALASLDDVLKRVAAGTLTKVFRIQGFGDGRWQEPSETGRKQITLEIEETTQPMAADVEIFVKSNNQAAIVGILKAAASQIESWDAEHFANWFTETTPKPVWAYNHKAEAGDEHK